MKSDFQTLIIKKELPNLQVNINRPEKRNALNHQVIDELTICLNEAAAKENLKSITISGEGTAFCSGADLEYLKDLRQYDDDKNLSDTRALAGLYQQIYTFPKPVIAAVNGPALAGGCGLATVCDIVLASESAVFGYPEVRIGFVAAIVSLFLIRQIGERKARELLLSGRILNAREALSFGLINKVVPHHSLDDEISEWQSVFSKNAPSALHYTKELFNTFQYTALEDMLAKFTDINVTVRRTPEFLEGISAFLEKRKPMWQQ